jgi:prepilin-type processing-associated H-X9-DG protein
MASPASISVTQISQKAKASVEKALQAHSTTFPKPNYVFGFLPPRTIGIIIRNPDGKVALGAAHETAAALQGGVAGALGMRGGSANVLFGDGHLTLGFEPPDPVFFEE